MKSCILRSESYPQHTIAYFRVIPTHTGTATCVVRAANDFCHADVTANIRTDRMARLKENMYVGKTKNLDKYGAYQFTELLSVASVSP